MVVRGFVEPIAKELPMGTRSNSTGSSSCGWKAVGGGMTNLTEAVEGSHVAINKGEQFSSFDVDAFEVPGGRDEIWRFTREAAARPA